MTKTIFLISTTLMLSACEPFAVFSTATSVGTSAVEERGVGGVISDASIKAQINGLWLAHDSTINQNIELQVREGRVLLSGTVDNVQQQIDAVRLAWKVSGVREVIDETKVGAGSGITGYACDTWISTKLKSNMLFNSDIQSINYNVKTVDGTVYVMGIAQDQAELDRVLTLIKSISGVKKITNFVRLKSDINGTSNYGDTVTTSHDASDSNVMDASAIEVETIQ